MTTALQRARAAFARRDWAEALEGFRSAPELEASDHERMAVCAYLTGDDEASVRAWEAGHRAALDAGAPDDAALCGFWIVFCLMMRGQMAPAGGWLGRVEGLIEERALDCAARGYLLVPKVLRALHAGQPDAARELGAEAERMASRFGDADLRAFGILGQAQAHVALGDTEAGMARFDEVMVSVTSGEVGPIVSGVVYCVVILECMRLFDLRRASEWTEALTAWCEGQPDLVPYRGQCLVHRSQISQASGDWRDAQATVASACARLADPPHPALGLARYQEAELHRLLGETEAAQEAYREALRFGHEPMPGLALLELVRGDVEAAVAGIKRALAEEGHEDRPALLAAAVDILRAGGDLPGARAAAEELVALAGPHSSDVLRAMGAQAMGSVLLAEGDPAGALGELRRAAATWAAAPMPYEGARTAVLIGLACAVLGDRSSAALEFRTARETFGELGAAPDLERLDALMRGVVDDEPPEGSKLSPREREVLAHVAAGETNREIAEALVISQHTVGRHLENIFAKLGVTSRAAATAYAYEHELL